MMMLRLSCGCQEGVSQEKIFRKNILGRKRRVRNKTASSRTRKKANMAAAE
jgi:hypothetical protein